MAGKKKAKKKAPVINRVALTLALNAAGKYQSLYWDSLREVEKATGRDEINGMDDLELEGMTDDDFLQWLEENEK